MSTFSQRRGRWWLISASMAALMTGCATQPAPLYQWGSYESEVYGSFKGDSPEGQIQRLEAQLQTTSASGAAVPPGLHATLGMLHVKVGHIDKGVAALEREKALFPESAPYMDRLLARARK